MNFSGILDSSIVKTWKRLNATFSAQPAALPMVTLVFRSARAVVTVAALSLLNLLNRELQILRRLPLRVRDFLNTEYCSRLNQRHFGGKMW